MGSKAVTASEITLAGRLRVMLSPALAAPVQNNRLKHKMHTYLIMMIPLEKSVTEAFFLNYYRVKQ